MGLIPAIIVKERRFHALNMSRPLLWEAEVGPQAWKQLDTNLLLGHDGGVGWMAGPLQGRVWGEAGHENRGRCRAEIQVHSNPHSSKCMVRELSGNSCGGFSLGSWRMSRAPSRGVRTDLRLWPGQRRHTLQASLLFTRTLTLPFLHSLLPAGTKKNER